MDVSSTLSGLATSGLKIVGFLDPYQGTELISELSTAIRLASSLMITIGDDIKSSGQLNHTQSRVTAIRDVCMRDFHLVYTELENLLHRAQVLNSNAESNPVAPNRISPTDVINALGGEANVNALIQSIRTVCEEFQSVLQILEPEAQQNSQAQPPAQPRAPVPPANVGQSQVQLQNLQLAGDAMRPVVNNELRAAQGQDQDLLPPPPRYPPSGSPSIISKPHQPFLLTPIRKLRKDPSKVYQSYFLVATKKSVFPCMSNNDKYEIQPYSSTASILSSQYTHAQARSRQLPYCPLSKIPSQARSEINKLLWRKNKSHASPYQWSLISVCYDFHFPRNKPRPLLKRIFLKSSAQPKITPPYLVILRGKLLSKAEWEERQHNPLSSLDTLELPPPDYQSSYSESDTDSMSSFNSNTDSDSYFTDDEYVTDSEDDDYVVDIVRQRDDGGRISNREWEKIMSRDYEKQDRYHQRRQGYGCRLKFGGGRHRGMGRWYGHDNYDGGVFDCDYGNRDEKDDYRYVRQIAEARRQNRGIWQRETDLMIVGAARNLDILDW